MTSDCKMGNSAYFPFKEIKLHRLNYQYNKIEKICYFAEHHSYLEVDLTNYFSSKINRFKSNQSTVSIRPRVTC